MKTNKLILPLITIFISFFSLSQEENKINSFRLDYVRHHFWQPNYIMTPQDRWSFVNNISHSFKDELIPENRNIDFSFSYGLWKKYNSKQDLFTETHFGIRYKKILAESTKRYKQGELVYTHRSLGSFDVSMYYNYTKEVNYVNYELISVSARQMLWSNEDKRFSFGLGVLLNIGYEINSKLTEKKLLSNYIKSTYTREYSYKVSITNLKNEFVFSGTIPLEASMRFSKNKSRFLYNTKFIVAINLIMEPVWIGSVKQIKRHINSGIGLQVGF